MSRYQRVTVYDKTTGKNLGTGGAEDPRMENHRRNGDIIVEGARRDETMWDFATGTIIEDTERKQKEQDRDQEIQDNRAARREARQWLIDNEVTNTNMLEAVKRLAILHTRI